MSLRSAKFAPGNRSSEGSLPRHGEGGAADRLPRATGFSIEVKELAGSRQSERSVPSAPLCLMAVLSVRVRVVYLHHL